MSTPTAEDVSFVLKTITEYPVASVILSGVLCSALTYWFFWKGYIMIPHVAKEFATIKESNKNMAAQLADIKKELDEAHIERQQSRENDKAELAELRKELRQMNISRG